MEWAQLSPQDSNDFLNAVTDSAEPAIFDAALCDVYGLPISFYDGYHLIRIVNRHMMPYLTLDYLSNGEDHYYLDGSEAAFHKLNARQALSLSDDNAINYLDFYISYVYERGNSLDFIRKKDSHSAALLGSDDGGRFKIEAPLSYQGGEINAQILVETNGAIHIEAPLRTSFLTELQPHIEINYRHPMEEKILGEAKSLLAQSVTGQALLDKVQNSAIDLRILNSPNYQGYIANNLTIYLTMPSAEQTGKYLQAIVLAYCLRDADQISNGFTRPSYKDDKTKFISTNHLKNLDMIEEICTIVEELEGQNIPEAYAGLEALDLEDVYQAYKNNVEGPELMQVYIDSLEKKDLVEGA